MIQTLINSFIDSLADVTQNPLSITIFLILSFLIVSLIFASIFESWREVLVNIKFLEEDERPSSLLLWIICVIILVKLVQSFLIQPFIVDGGSMLNTFHNKEFLLVDKISYRLHKPSRGDVMIFKLYEGASNKFTGKYLIKRVMGLPGERIVINGGGTTIYNKENPDGFILEEPFVTYKDLGKNTDTTLDEHSYFMLGDNRAQSYDSRDWGPLHEKDIKGLVLLRIIPISTFAYKPGSFLYTK